MEYHTDTLVHGVSIVTACHEERKAGLAVAWATQVASDRVLICVGSQSYTRELILASGWFGMSLLRSNQRDLAALFGRKSSLKVDKFAGLTVFNGEHGMPLLADCAGSLECEVVDVFTTGKDQSDRLIIGRIAACHNYLPDAERLVYRSSDY